MSSEAKYTEDHEYVRIDGDIATLGISVYAQEQLGDVVYVELPEVGKSLGKGDEAAVVESVKAASEVSTPVSGEVVEINGELDAAPGTVNEDAMGKGWFLKIKISDASEADNLMNEANYKTFVEGLA